MSSNLVGIISQRRSIRTMQLFSTAPAGRPPGLKMDDTLRLGFQNFSGFLESPSHPKNNSFCSFITKHDFDIFGVAKTNVKCGVSSQQPCSSMSRFETPGTKRTVCWPATGPPPLELLCSHATLLHRAGDLPKACRKGLHCFGALGGVSLATGGLLCAPRVGGLRRASAGAHVQLPHPPCEGQPPSRPSLPFVIVPPPPALHSPMLGHAPDGRNPAGEGGLCGGEGARRQSAPHWAWTLW